MSYNATELNLARLANYAKRVAHESATIPTNALTRTESRVVQVEHERGAGLFGLRKERFVRDEVRSETVEILGAHWVLFQTAHWIEEGEAGSSLEYNEQNQWVLTADGQLRYVWRWQEFVRRRGVGQGEFSTDVEVSPMSREKVLEMDHAHPFYETRHGAFHCWGDRKPGKLIRHAPGVGLSLALKALMPSS